MVKDLAPAEMQDLIVELAAASEAGNLDYVKDLIFAIRNIDEPIVHKSPGINVAAVSQCRKRKSGNSVSLHIICLKRSA